MTILLRLSLFTMFFWTSRIAAFNVQNSRILSSIHRGFAPSAYRYQSSRLFSSDAGVEKTEEEKAAIKAAREARKAEKERMKAEKKAKKAAEAAARLAEENKPIEAVTFLSVDDAPSQKAGDFTTVMSRSRTGRNFVNVKDLPSMEPGNRVWLRGRLNSIRVKGGSCFLVLRQDSFDTVQALFFKTKEDAEGSKEMLKYLKTLTVESVIDIEGTLTEADVKSCSVQNLELNIERIHTVSKAAAMLPFLVEDAARSEKEIEESQDTERPFPRLGQELRLDNRWMDMRAPAQNAIIRVQSGVPGMSTFP